MHCLAKIPRYSLKVFKNYYILLQLNYMSKHPNSLKDLEVRQPTSKKGKTKLGTEQGKKELAMNFFWAQLIFFKKIVLRKSALI